MTSLSIQRNFRVYAVLATFFGCTVSFGATAAERATLGQWSKHACSGAYDSAYRYEVTEVNGDMVRYEIDRDGKAGWLEKSLDHTGTTLFKARDRGDGKGKRGQKIRGKFDGISDLVSGKTFSGRVDEWHNQSQWTWKYTITIGQRETVNDPLLGSVEVATITERRRVEGGSYSSVMKVVVTVAEPRKTLSWEYSDEKGTQKCRHESRS